MTHSSPQGSTPNSSKQDEIAKLFEKAGGYNELCNLHYQLHEDDECFCTTEIAGHYKKILNVISEIATTLAEERVKSLPELTDEKCYNCGQLMFWFDDQYRCIYDGFHNSYSLAPQKESE